MSNKLPRYEQCVLDMRFWNGTFLDYSPFGNNGVNTGCAWEQRGDLHLRFQDNATDRITVAHSPSLAFDSGQITVLVYGDFLRQQQYQYGYI